MPHDRRRRGGPSSSLNVVFCEFSPWITPLTVHDRQSAASACEALGKSGCPNAEVTATALRTRASGFGLTPAEAFLTRHRERYGQSQPWGATSHTKSNQASRGSAAVLFAKLVQQPLFTMLRTPASLRRLSLAVSTTSKSFDPQAGLASVGTGALLRSATVMSALRLPGGTAIAQSTLQAATTSPAAAALVSAAASGRFTGGATLDDAKRTAAALAEDGITTIVDHGVEEADDVQLELARKRQLVAAADGLTVPIKPTAVADGAMLRALADLIQQAPDSDAARLDGELVERLSAEHQTHFEDAVEGLVRLARDAEAAGGALLLDAEMTDLQPAVDRLFLSTLERWASRDKALATYAAVWKSTSEFG